MAGKESMTDKTNAGSTGRSVRRSVSDDLLRMLKNDYTDRNDRSLYFRYKEKQMKDKYEDYRGKGGKATDFFSLCDRYEAAKTSGGLKDYLAYFLFVKELLADKEYIRSGRDIFTKEIDPDVLKGFKDRWNGYLLAYGFEDKVFGPEQATVTQVCEKFRTLEPDGGRALDLDEVAEVTENIHAEAVRYCIHRAVKNDFENMADSKTYNRDLLDLCAEEGLLKTGFSESARPGYEVQIDECVRLLQEIYDLPGRQDYETAFIPLSIDRRTGVSLCIVGKLSFLEHYRFLRSEDPNDKDFEMYENCPFPCIPAVLRFTDAAFGSMFSSDRYEIQSGYLSGPESGISKEYYSPDTTPEERRNLLLPYVREIYSDYNDAKRNARCLLREIDHFRKKTESLSELTAYKALFIDAMHTEEAEKKKETLAKEFDEKRRS